MLIGGLEVLYQGNQNTKFLHGLAAGGRGYLNEDWLANTRDPLPVFSLLVRVTYQYLDEMLFYLFQLVLIGVYLYSLIGIADHFYNLRRKKLLFFIFVSIYLLSYSIYWPGSIPETLYYGVAGQDFGFYIFLPNAFLALLFLSILQYLNKKPFRAVASITIACYFHSGYLVVGASLVAAYLILEYFENKDLKRSIRLGAIALLLVLPVVIYSTLLNQNTTSEQVSQATSIVVNQVIPQHTLVTQWWNDSAFYKILIILAAMLVSRRIRLLPIFAIALILIAFPAIILFIRPSNKIAFMQLWRVSTLAVPLASTILLASVVNYFYTAEEQVLSKGKALVVVILLVLMIMPIAHGFDAQITKIEREYKQSELALMDEVALTAGKGQIYLIPPRETLLLSFRIQTGIPIFVDEKSHPYNAVEILEWQRRIELADEFYLSEGQESCTILTDLVAEYGITHVVRPREMDISCQQVQIIHENKNYIVYQINPQ
jgi:hypothetical protein